MIPPSPTNPSSPSVHPHHGQSSPPAFRKHAVPEHSNKPLAGGGEAAREGGRGGAGLTAFRIALAANPTASMSSHRTMLERLGGRRWMAGS